MSVKKYVKTALADNGMSQKELAKILKITPATLSNSLKNGNIGYKRVEEIASILGYEIIWKKKNEQNINQTINNNGNINNIGNGSFIEIQNNNK